MDVKKLSGASGSLDEALLQLREEFLGDAQDDLSRLTGELADGDKSDAHLQSILKGAFLLAVRLKGGAGSYELAVLSMAAERFESFLGNAEKGIENVANDLLVSLDILTEIIELSQSGEEVPGDLVRRMPLGLTTFDPEDVVKTEVRILLVMGEGLATKVIEREISECGYNVLTVHSPYEALQRVVLEQPDLAIFSAVLPEISGVDLAIGMKAMPSTRNTAVAIITSYERDHHELSLLPETVSVIRKGTGFADDLGTALKEQFLL